MTATPNPNPTPPQNVTETVERGVQFSTELATVALRITLIVVGAILLRWILHRAIRKVVDRAVATPAVPESLRTRFGEPAGIATERRRQRSTTVGSVLRSVATILVFGVAFATVLGELGVDLGPILASAGIIGVAVGFGAQNLVRDFLNGIAMILEDQYGVGDAIDVGEANGIVEAVGLRITRLRNVDGTVWHVRNGEIVRVGNMSQGWSRALLDISVAYGTDVEHASGVIKRVADELWHDELVGDLVLAEPEVWGVEMLAADGIDIRLVVKTVPLEQWKVARELRQRLKEAFDEEGIEIPFPQRALWLRNASEDPLSAAAEPGSGSTSAAPPAPAGAPGGRTQGSGGQAQGSGGRTQGSGGRTQGAGAGEEDPNATRRVMRRPDANRSGEADVARDDTSVIRRPGPVSPTGPADDGVPPEQR